jgi:hypothetical protein
MVGDEPLEIEFLQLCYWFAEGIERLPPSFRRNRVIDALANRRS